MGEKKRSLHTPVCAVDMQHALKNARHKPQKEQDNKTMSDRKAGSSQRERENALKKFNGSFRESTCTFYGEGKMLSYAV